MSFDLNGTLRTVPGGARQKLEHDGSKEEDDRQVRALERIARHRATQAEAIQRAKQLDPDAPLHLERVRESDRGGRDQWRKP